MFEQAAQTYADAMWANEVKRCTSTPIGQNRFAEISEDAKAKFREGLLADAKLVVEMCLDPARLIEWRGQPTCLIQRAGQGMLHPDNKISRQLFTDVTGVTLPPTVGGTQAIVRAYVGDELWNRYFAAREAERLQVEQEKADAAKLIEDQRLASIKSRFLANEYIKGAEFVDLAKSLEVSIHPRTIGVLREKIHEVAFDGRCTMLNKRHAIPQGVSIAHRDVKAKL